MGKDHRYFLWKAPVNGLPEFTSGGHGVVVTPGFGNWVILMASGREIPPGAIPVGDVVAYLEGRAMGDWQPKEPDGRLCYVSGGRAYFTTLPLTGDDCQWGDDWNDVPYEHNAGAPYGDCEWVDFCRGLLDTPDASYLNSPWSVQKINAGETPWLSTRHGVALRSTPEISINAGVTFREFQSTLLKAGGTALAPWLDLPPPPTEGGQNDD